MGLTAALGADVVWQSEVDPYANRVLAERFPGVRNLGDIVAVTRPPRVDLVCGGFPCGDLSIAGKKAGLVAGEQSSKYAHMLRVADESQAPVVVIENVPDLIRRADWFVVLLRDLVTYGWTDIRWGMVSAESVGAPHRRNRAFLVARRPGVTLHPSSVVIQRWPRGGDEASTRCHQCGGSGIDQQAVDADYDEPDEVRE